MLFRSDKEGFLRSERSLIQIIGRCARNDHGRVVLYADEVTDSMMNAVSETNRRRKIQEEYNKANGITPKTVKKAVRDVFNIVAENSRDSSGKGRGKSAKGGIDAARLINEGVSGGTEEENNKLIDKLTVEMTKAAKDLDFERAAEIRDIIIELKGKK